MPQVTCASKWDGPTFQFRSITFVLNTSRTKYRDAAHLGGPGSSVEQTLANRRSYDSKFIRLLQAASRQ